MTTTPTERERKKGDDLATLVEQKPRGVVREFWGLLRHNRKWWLAPIIVVSLLVGVLLILFGTPVAPLIYTLF
ncbi:MAG TPA: DUF5989 family protein [Candidatus Krumholzibacteria bacterium]|nr:DUF5989 family protein [Candidatus Krumholzibacteria bacterium]